MSVTIPSKEAVVVILDVGKSMSAVHHNSKDAATPLEGALKAVNLLVQQKILFGKKDELGFVLCGTKETENGLADTGYEHITVAREITTPDLDLLRYIEKIVPGNHVGDLLDALIVAMDMLNRKTAGKKYQRRIFLVTDAGSPINEDGWDKIASHFRKMEARLNIIGIDFSNEEEKTPGRHPSNERKLRRLAAEVEGVVVAVHQALEMMSYFRSRSVAQRTTFRGALEITPLLKIGVWGWPKTYPMKFPSMKKLSAISQQSANPTSMAVQLERTYTSLADPDQTVAPTEVMKGYKYGKSLIPIPKYDEKIMKYATEKCLQLIGFTDASSIPRHHYMENTECISPDPGDPHAATALSALIHALAETDSVAIVRYVKRENANPKLGFLAPHIKAAYECLYFNSLPFSEDLRQYQFAPLAIHGSSTAKKSFIPNEEQLKSAQKLIDSLDLMTAAMDEDGNPMESLKPRYTYNPSLQRFYQCVQHRALAPDTPVPKLDPLISHYVNPDERLFSDATPSLKEFSTKFPLEKTERAEKTRRKFWGQQTGDEDVRLDSYVPDPATKKRKLEGQMGDFSLEKLVSIGTNDVGSINPVQDFKDMLARRDVDLVDKAIEQMKSRILQLINDSIKDQFYPKAMECLVALRDGSIRESESEVFNTFLITLRNDYEGKRRDDFWQFLVRRGITLIHSEEADDSGVSPEEAEAFLMAPSQGDSSAPSTRPTNNNNDDVDDLFNQLE